MKLEPYQQRAAEWLSRQRLGIVKMAAGSGKTITAAAALNMVLERKQRDRLVRIGWICPTIETKEQAWKAIEQFPELAKQDWRIECATPGVDMRDRDVLVVDECKHATAPCWKEIVEQVPVRFGLDATPLGYGPRDKLLLDLFGNNLFEVERWEVEQKRLVSARVIMLNDSDDCGEEIDKMVAKLLPVRRCQMRDWSEGQVYASVAWQCAVERGIVGNKARTEAALGVIQSSKIRSPVLVLVNQVEHAQAIATACGGIATFSGMGAKNRREAIQGFKAGTVQVLVATSMLDEGADVPNAGVLVLVSGGKSKQKAEQRTGRVLRSFTGKTEGVIYDFADTFHPLMQRHAKARMSLYRSLGYKVEYAGVGFREFAW